MDNLPEDIWHHVPGWVSASVLISTALIFILSKLSAAYEPVARLIPVLGKRWRARATSDGRDHLRIDSELKDLRRQINFLNVQLTELRVRDEMYWAWILSDQEWHRQHEFDAAQRGHETNPHVSFMDFRDQWMRRYGTTTSSRIKKQESPF